MAKENKAAAQLRIVSGLAPYSLNVQFVFGHFNIN